MLRFKKLDIFIARQFSLLFIGTFFICQFVLMMQFLWKYIDMLIGKGLSMDVLAQFFWYMALMLVPQALPLAILLSSLITYGNLGESSELTAIKAAGISLVQSFRSLIVITVMLCLCSFWFQNVVGPHANVELSKLMISMKQKSPELEIPEGIFYDGVPQSNIYVQRKDLNTGKLYGVMIYRMTESYEDAAIILADSAMLQSTAEKKHLVMTLWSGEWFENMRSQDFGNTASVPYRRETFVSKKIVMDFDGDFNMADAGGLSNDARGKSLEQIRVSIDSLNHVYDSIGRSYYRYAMGTTYSVPHMTKSDSVKAVAWGKEKSMTLDTLFNRLPLDKKQQVANAALNQVQAYASDLDFKSMLTSDGDRIIRGHVIEMFNKFTVALSCLLFFFIGAPLGAIIRKGGLGFPVVISVLVFIVYYILDNSGYRMARLGSWDIWFGKTLALAVLSPVAVFVTYKANNDSTVFNIDLYRELLKRLLGMRIKRHLYAKDVIINLPDYDKDLLKLAGITADVKKYEQEHTLRSLPNPVTVFFKYKPDHEIERISEEMELLIEDLHNTRSRQLIVELNRYPVLSVKAHTRPFERQWLNGLSAVVLPLGIFFYLRMVRFRLRLYKDLRVICQNNERISRQVEDIVKQRNKH
ncbi:MAG: LptF/LptG family permease [Prevotella sp.]|nr:LptF/LptG family permease [Prevotella sp.]